MQEKRRYNTKRIFGNVLWALLGMATVVLLGAAISLKHNKRCKGIMINIKGVQNNFFINKNEVNDLLEKINGGGFHGQAISSVNILKMERELQKSQWIKSALLYFDNNEILKVNISEREPIARIFTNTGTSFYIDSAIERLPLSDKFSARVPVFTNFSNAIMLYKADSNLLTDIKNISNYILNNPFWMAQIEQINITDDKTFELIPKVGNHIIVFGGAEKYEQKFDHLLAFYKEVETKVGWNTYSKINVQYKDQVVAVKRGAEDILQDSLRAKILMQTLVANAQKAANDSTNNIQLDQIPDDNTIPLATQKDDLPKVQTIISKPITITPDKTIHPSAEGPNPALDKKLIAPIPEKKISTPGEKPFWLRMLHTRLTPTKKLLIKIKSTSFKKPNPIPLKRTFVKKPMITKPAIIKPATNKSGNKPVVKQVTKSKTQTPPNDY
ncbi:MAG: hypothetical protein M3004_13090 [Bacteroidota bacterium]|nr:hypothetical protein [Bacteroidota bacterium]